MSTVESNWQMSAIVGIRGQGWKGSLKNTGQVGRSDHRHPGLLQITEGVLIKTISSLILCYLGEFVMDY